MMRKYLSFLIPILVLMNDVKTQQNVALSPTLPVIIFQSQPSVVIIPNQPNVAPGQATFGFATQPSSVLQTQSITTITPSNLQQGVTNPIQQPGITESGAVPATQPGVIISQTQPVQVTPQNPIIPNQPGLIASPQPLQIISEQNSPVAAPPTQTGFLVPLMLPGQPGQNPIPVIFGVPAQPGAVPPIG